MFEKIEPLNASTLFLEADPLAHLDQLIKEAAARGASKLLLLSGKPVVCRVNGHLSEPVFPGRIHFSQVERLVNALLDTEQGVILDAEGSVETDYSPASQGNGAADRGSVNINIFYGDGAHNLVVFLD